ncbi:MAG: PEP-CTERM sorting domain-containing protein [Phycisphaerae bacterium]
MPAPSALAATGFAALFATRRRRHRA